MTCQTSSMVSTQGKSWFLPQFPFVLGGCGHPFTKRKMIQQICTKQYPWAFAWHSPIFNNCLKKNILIQNKRNYKVCLPFCDCHADSMLLTAHAENVFEMDCSRCFILKKYYQVWPCSLQRLVMPEVCFNLPIRLYTFVRRNLKT